MKLAVNPIYLIVTHHVARQPTTTPHDFITPHNLAFPALKCVSCRSAILDKLQYAFVRGAQRYRLVSFLGRPACTVPLIPALVLYSPESIVCVHLVRWRGYTSRKRIHRCRHGVTIPVVGEECRSTQLSYSDITMSQSVPTHRTSADKPRTCNESSTNPSQPSSARNESH